MKRMLLAVAAIFLMAAPAYAQVAGKWTGEQQGRNGTQPVVLEVKVDGGKLVGTMTTGTNPAVQIAEGKVDGMKVSFMTTVSFNGNERQISWSGEAKGDELTLTRQAGGQAGGNAPPPVVLKRAK
jgi:hypothetical protein